MTIVRMNSSGLLLTASVAQYGTGFSSIDDDEVIVGGTTSTNPLQKVEFDTDGSLLISQGASALPLANQNPNLLGCESVAETQVVSSPQQFVEFKNWSSDFFQYEIDVYDAVPDTSPGALQIRFSSNNGVSYDNGATDYFYWFGFEGFDTTNNYTIGNTTHCRAFYGNFDNTNLYNHTKLVFVNPLASVDGNGFTCTARGYSVAQATRIYGRGHGRRATAMSINAVQIGFTSGNIASGTFKCKRIRA